MGNVDIRPDLCSEGGGLIDDFDAVISDVRFGLSPDGYVSGQPVTLCLVRFDVDGEEHTVLFTIGGEGDFVADDTGRGLNKLKSKATLTKTCKFIMFVNSLVESGFPLNRLDPQDVSPIIGTYGHFLRKAVEYKGLKKKSDERENTVLLCTKILQLPWDATPKQRKGKGKAVDANLADTVAGIIQGIVLVNDGEIAKKDLLSALFANEDINAMDDKKGALKVASSDSFLKEREEWSYEGGVLKMV